MGKLCIICAHDKRVEIDKKLVEPKAQYSAISREYFGSTAQRDALRRHKANGHIKQKIAKAADAKIATEADDLLNQVRSLSNRALSILSQAEGAGDLRTACSAIREVRSTLELLLKVSGELKGDQTTVNVAVVTHEYILVKGTDPNVRTP
jgi:hypothetical protein